MYWDKHHQTTFLLKNLFYISIKHEISAVVYFNVSLLGLATSPNSRVGSGSGSTRNRTAATGLTSRKTRPTGNGPVWPQKPSISISQLCLQLSIWVLIVSWHDQYVDCAVLSALSHPDLRYVIRPIFVESLLNTRQFRFKQPLFS